MAQEQWECRRLRIHSLDCIVGPPRTARRAARAADSRLQFSPQQGVQSRAQGCAGTGAMIVPSSILIGQSELAGEMNWGIPVTSVPKLPTDHRLPDCGKSVGDNHLTSKLATASFSFASWANTGKTLICLPQTLTPPPLPSTMTPSSSLLPSTRRFTSHGCIHDFLAPALFSPSRSSRTRCLSTTLSSRATASYAEPSPETSSSKPRRKPLTRAQRDFLSSAVRPPYPTPTPRPLSPPEPHKPSAPSPLSPSPHDKRQN